MELESLIISAGVTFFSFGLLIISLASYRKYRNVKLLFISLILIIFFIKGILLSLSLFFPEVTLADDVLYGTYSGLFDLSILILLFIATLKR